MLRRLSAAVSAAALLALAPAAAHAVDTDHWLRWNGPDVQVRALEFTGPDALAGTEGAGVFANATFGALAWEDASDGLAGAQKNIRAIETVGGATLIGTTEGLFRRTGGGWAPVAQGDGPRRLNAAVQAIHARAGAPNELLVGVASGGVLRSTDGGEHWDPSGAGLQPAESVWALASSPLFPNRVFAGTSHGVYRSENGGATWTLASDGLPAANVVDFAIDPLLPKVMYAASPSAGVFVSEDFGLSWRKANGVPGSDLGDTAVRAIRPYLPQAGKPIFSMVAATGKGVWATADKGQTWAPMSKKVLGGGDMHPMVEALALQPGLLFAGTHAAGAYKLPITPIKAAGAVKISGTPKVGQVLTATHDEWEGTRPHRLVFAWKRCDPLTDLCSTIEGASSETYPLTDADEGRRIRVTLSGTNLVPGASGSLTSAATAKVAPSDSATLANTPKPTLGGGPTVDPKSPSQMVGETLTGRRGDWTPAPTSHGFQWQRCKAGACADIPGAAGDFEGATTTAYTLTTADVGHTIRMRVVARKGAYTGAAESGPTMTVIEPKPRLESAPAIVGEPYIGETVSSTAGVWFEATKWERSWQLCDDAACGAYAPAGTDAVFAPNATMRGKWLRLRVTARNTHPSHATEAFSPIVGRTHAYGIGTRPDRRSTL